MYKLNKNKIYYKSDQITTSVQRLNSTSQPTSNLYPTLIQRHVFAGGVNKNSKCYIVEYTRTLSLALWGIQERFAM